MPTSFELETRDGIRKVDLDPDAFRFRDIRILIDGERVAEMPYPKAATPYHEVTFQLGRHELVAIAHLLPEPNLDEPFGLHYDLFANGRSLSNGGSLEDARERAPAPGEAYPESFKVVDMVLRVAPATAAPGLAVGVSGAQGGLAWPAMLGIVVVMLGTVALATVVAGRAWARIRADTERSVKARTILGAGAVIGTYAVALGLTLVLALSINPAD